MNRTVSPALLVAAWVALTAALLWAAVASSVEPPVWDSMSYLAKGLNFWQAIATGQSFNPFDLQPTLRPPGTVLMSHPFGFSPDFHGFYFRSIFIPIILFAAAAFIANDQPHFGWSSAALSIALISMPMLYQFQANDLVPWEVNWGMVDNFMAGVAAVSAAAVLRSIRLRSILWAVVAALSAAFCFLIKPSGLIVMALAGVGWFTLLVWDTRAQLSALWKEGRLLLFAAVSLTLALAIFGATAYLGLKSEYFSTSNILFGNRVMAILADEIVIGLGLGDVLELIKISLGYIIPVLIGAGLVLAMRQKQYAVAAVSALCLVIGVWFWFIETEPMEPRYFVPFGIMSVVFLFPTLTGATASLSRKQYSVIGGLIILPGLITVLLLCLPSPPLFLQRALGVNLMADLFKNETAQASDLLNDLKAQGLTQSSIYRFNITPAQRSFEAQLSYTNLIDPTSPHVTILSPIDWQRATAFRIEDMSRAAFLVFEPVLSEYNRQQIFAQRNIPDLNFETYLISAWASTLGEAQGVKLVSETQLRVLKIVDAKAFEAAFQDLVARHDWPEAFTQSNQARWWSVNELDAYLAQSDTAPVNIAFDLNPAQPRTIVHAVKTGFKGTMYDADIWVTSDANETWTLFAHVVDQNGEIVRNAQVNLVGHTSEDPTRNIRRYTLIYPDLPPEAVSLAFGFFHPKDKDMEFLQAGIGQRDWDGRRVIVPLNKTTATK